MSEVGSESIRESSHDRGPTRSSPAPDRPGAGLVSLPGGVGEATFDRAPREHRVGGCRVIEHGRGARVFVGLHGWSGSHASFDPLVRELPVDVTFFAFDLPGAGESSPPATWTTDALVERLEAALNELDLESFTLVAACGAVGPAMRLSSRRAGQVERLILIDPFTAVPWYFRVFTLRGLGRFFYWMTFANPIGRWLTDGALSGRRVEGASLTQGFATVRHRDNLGLLAAFCDAARVPLEAQAGYAGPVDVLFGERTFAHVLRAVASLRSTYARARAYAIPKAGHIPMHEAPEVVADLVFRAERGGGSHDAATSNAAPKR